MKNSADVIIVGGGAMGSAAAWHLARKGQKVIVFDQFKPPHKFGSTHGDTRITRQAIGENKACTPLSLRSYELWRELESLTGVDLLTITGGLMMTSYSTGSEMHGNRDFLQETIDAAEMYGIKYSLFNTEEIRKEFPQFNLIGDEQGYYEPMAGFLRPENCIRAQTGLAMMLGAVVHSDEEVTAVKPLSGPRGVIVETKTGHYAADKVIVSAGAWVSRFLEKKYSGLFKVYRQVMYWFGVKDSIEPYTIGNFPIFIWISRNDFVYGFPAIDGPNGGVKIAGEQKSLTADPDTVNREVSPLEINTMYEDHIRQAFPGLTSECIKTVPCLYTVTPDSQFIIDFHPEHPQIIVASPCSGHGFKHSAAIGEVLAELATDGKSRIDISSFAFSRFFNTTTA